MRVTSRKTVRKFWFLALLALGVFVSSLPLMAQYRGGLQGTVTDPQGSVIPGAKVTVTSIETNRTRTVTSSGSGVYSVNGLAPGQYSVTVEAPGFTKKTLPSVNLTSDQSQGQDVQLAVGAPSKQTVTVTASTAPAIDTEDATISGTFSGREVRDLPTFGRDPFQVAALAPGAFGDNARSSGGSGSQNLPGSAGPGGTTGTNSVFQTENQVQVVANGTRNNSNSFQVDGISVNSLAWGGAAVITPNQESVKEVTVQSNPYSAVNGRNSGAQVLTVTKNGTNEFHGSALFVANRPGLNAFQRYNGPFNSVQRDTDRFNQWAGSLGGPIIKNHLFFFFSYETLRNSSQSTALNWYETPQYLTAVQSAAPNSIAAKIAGYPGEGVAFNQIINRSCASAGITAANLCAPVFSNGNYIGLDVGSPLRLPRGTPDPGFVNNGNFGSGNGLDGVPDIFYVQTVNPTDSSPQQFNGRADYQATSSDLITFTTYYVPNNSTFYNGPVRPANFWHSNRLNETAAVLWNHVISPTWLNEARFNVTRWNFNEISSNPQEPWGLPQAQVANFGSITPQYLGAPGPGIFAQTTFNFRDTASTVIGNHSIKFGPDLYWEQDNDSVAYAARPTYLFRNLWNLANDAPYQETGNFNPTTGQPTSATKYIRSAIYAGFVQDDWKVLPNLTVNLGIRWEYFQPVHEKYGNISNVVLGPGQNPLTGLKLRVGGNLYKASYKNWSPQFGFAWRPDPNSQRMVIRGGFGIGYNRSEEAITLNGRSNPPLVSNLTLTGSNILYQVPDNVNQFSGYPVNPNARQTIDPATNLPVGGAGAGSPLVLNGFPSFLPTTYTYRYSFGTQYDLGRNWVASVGYQGSSSRHYTRQNNLNYLFAPLNPRIQNLFYYTNDANSSYNALLTEVQHRFAQSFQVDAQYRWAKTIDEGSNGFFIGNYPYGLQYLRGLADSDVRHLAKLYGTWTPQIFKSQGWKEKIIGGWQLSGILNWHTGFPWTPLYSNTNGNVVYSNSGYQSLQPAAYLGGRGKDYSNDQFKQPNGNFPGGALNYFTVPTYNTADFPASGGPPPAPQVGRNILRGPSYFDVDMTLQKSFGLPSTRIFGENARLEFRGNLFNIFNKTNLSPLTANAVDQQISTDGTTSNPLFGQPQSGLAGRIVTLQARFSF